MAGCRGYRTATPGACRKPAAEAVFRGSVAGILGMGKQGCGEVGGSWCRAAIHALTWGVGSQSGGVVGTVAETAGLSAGS